MKKLLLSVFGLTASLASAQLSTGDLSFIGFNADADDDLAFVTFVDIPANTNVFFCDSEWDGSAFGDDENDFYWSSGATVIPAGTVITLNTISAVPSSNYGTINGEPGGISGSAEAIFAYNASIAEPRNASSFICAIANSGSAYGDLSNTGLTEGLTAITLPSGTDIAEYNGARTGMDVSGYQLALNTIANMDVQDDSGDQSADGTVPDVPFNTTAFTISTDDLTAPTVATAMVSDATTVTVSYSETVTNATATNTANYTFLPALSISSVTFDTNTNTATVTHEGFTAGTAYALTVNNMEDAAGNTMTEAYTSDALFYNTTNSGLLITEIMYNAPSDDSDALEFLEIYNHTDASIALGGIMVQDEANFVFTFPEMDLAANTTVLLATDKTSADAFYGVTFLDMPQGLSNALGNGGELLQIVNSDQEVIFEVEYSDDAPWPTDADGDGPSLELLNPDGTIDEGTNWAAATNLVGQSLGADVYASPGTYTAVTNVLPQISFATVATEITEDGTNATLVIELSAAATDAVTVQVDLVTDLATATEGDDFTYTNQTITIPAGTTSYTLNIPIVNDTDSEADELFILNLNNPTNAELGAYENTGVYLIDNDTELFYPASPALDITYATSYLVDENGSAEIVTYDADSQRLFVMNSTASKVEVLDFSDIENISTLNTIDLTSYGTDGGTSIAVKDGLVAATISNGADADGLVVFMDIDGNNVTSVTVGNLPDMVVFSPDGTKVLTANEGQPNDDYTNDPEGSISVIDVSGGLSAISQTNVTNINFNSFDTDIDALRSEGIRIFGPDASVSEDLEPEYITFAADGNTAWVSLQENNALGVIDLTTNTITDILPLGYKNHSLVANSFDVSNKLDFVFMANWPTMGMYMPDAIASYEVNGVTYIVTANEGDSRDYDGYAEEARVGDDEYILDPTAFPNADYLKLDETLGRIKTTLANGDTDNDGDYDVIYTYGARSFSIWNGTTGAQVFDSGDDFERYTAADATYGALFNTSNDNNSYKNRSDDKGPEPEGVTVAEIDGSFYAFITLERMGGMMVYDVTDPVNAEFVAYKNHRDLGEDEGGDLGPEGILYIAPEDSPNGTGLVLMANEVSATVSVYTLDNVTLATEDFTTTNNFKLYPNPVKSQQTVFFSEAISGGLYDMTGRQLTTFSNQHQLQLPSLPAGTYILQVANGASQKIVIQ